MIVLDTTVLVYATGAEHPLREPCRQLVSALAERRLTAATTVEVIQEFAHVRARRSTRAEAAQLAGSFADLLAPLLTVTPEALAAGLTLFERSARLGAFDAVLAAAARDHSAQALVSADRAFAEVGGLDHVVPTTAALERLLAGS